ncbi:MAG TPA: phenylalanine--tRNA ligase subunit beta [Vicinamibacterales bacterium]|nr:phenylalanine--tRNA ligase subunit beta [Vicinamibacterales bacterium]
MKVLLSWLRDFVDVPGEPEDIASTMSLRGFAVEGLERLDNDDAVIDFEVTGNRPDCMSVSGMAREVATAFGLQVRRPAVATNLRRAREEGPALHLASLKTVDRADIDVVIENPDLCPRYAGAVADVTIGPSPEWMQARLRAAGVRPTSTIVDITNYVLLELGQPMHAFDHARVGGSQIRVRTAQPGETLNTLDGKRRELSPEMLVIADADHAVAVAGVMGGADSEVTETTRTIVFESAHFAPLSVRRTSKALGLKTEASMRFERGTDPRLPLTAMERACALLEMIGAGASRGTVVDRYPVRVEPKVLKLRKARIAGLLGVAIADAEVRRVLEALGFALREVEAGWDVTVPTRRVDVSREVDLIEEIARHCGFDRIPATFPPLAVAPPPVDPRILRARQLRALAMAQGFSEAVTFGFTSAPAAEAFVTDEAVVPIKNPLSEAFAVLRPSLLPGLVESAGRNIRRGQRDVQLFEIGNRFTQQGGETQAIAFIWTGVGRAPHWSERTRETDFFDASSLVSTIVDAFDAFALLQPLGAPPSFLVAGQAAEVVADAKDSPDSTARARCRVGLVGRLTPAVGESLGLPAEVPAYVGELAIQPLATFLRASLKATAPPRVPSVDRDISILLDDTTAAQSVRDTVRAIALPHLVSLREFDRYAGKGIPEGKVSLSLRLTFRAPDRTLTDAEVQSAMDRVLSTLRDTHGAIQR